MTTELWKNGEGGANESAGDFGDALSRNDRLVISGLRRSAEGGFETGVTHVQRYTMTRSQVESLLWFALTLKTRRMILAIQALLVVSHECSCGDLNGDVQEGKCKHGRDSYLMPRCHL